MTQQVSRDEIFPAMASSSFIFKSLIKLKTKDNKSFQFNLISSCLTLCKRNKQKSKLLLHLECTSLPFKNQLITQDQVFFFDILSFKLIVSNEIEKIVQDQVHCITHIVTLQSYQVTFLNILLCSKLTFFGHNLSKK